MKKIILSLTLVGGMLAACENLNAFTAVTSGAWSSAATWGGVGPGSTVTNQDIIIPSGITVDLDQDVAFDGLLNSFWVTGTLNNSSAHVVTIDNGTITGSGTIAVHRIILNAPTTIYSFTGPITVDVFTNRGSAVNLAAVVIVNDTLDLDQGAVVLGSGSDLQLMANSNIRVNSGVLTNNGGLFTALGPYDVWYFGATKIAGQELNSFMVQSVLVGLNNSAQDLFLSANTIINGTLYMGSGNVVLNGNRITIWGDIVANPGTMFESSGASDMEIGGGGADLSSPLIFSVGSTIDQLIISRDTHDVVLGSELSVTGQITLEEGSFVVDTVANLLMASGSTIRREYGEMIINGSFDGTQPYSVVYAGISCTTGDEISGTGLTNLAVNLDYSIWVIHLSQDLVLNGHLNLMYGEFDLNDYDLTLNGTFDQNSNALIWGSYLSNLTLSMSSSVNDTLFMRQAFYPLDQLTLDLPAGSIITLGANLYLTHLAFISGSIDVGNYVMKLGSASPQITGSSDANYVITNGYGWLWIFLMGNDPYTEFPVGTMSGYSPVALRSVGATANHNGYVAVRVIDGVWTDGYTGTDVSTSQSVVNKTWFMLEDSGMTVNLDVRCGWGSAMEMNGFDRQNCFIKNYNNMLWDSYPAAASGIGTFNTYTIERMGMTNTGYFAVVDNNSPLTVPEPVTSDFTIYPNPSNDFVNVQVVNPGQDNFQYELFDAAGRKILGTQNSNTTNQFDLREYERGSYTMRVTNLSTNEVITRLIIKS